MERSDNAVALRSKTTLTWKTFAMRDRRGTMCLPRTFRRTAAHLVLQGRPIGLGGRRTTGTCLKEFWLGACLPRINAISYVLSSQNLHPCDGVDVHTTPEKSASGLGCLRVHGYLQDGPLTDRYCSTAAAQAKRSLKCVRKHIASFEFFHQPALTG